MKNEAPTDIFDFAVKFEEDGEKFYRELAADSGEPGLKSIFNALADDEVRHAGIIRQMQKNIDPKMAKTTILQDAKSVFAGMSAKKGFRAAGDDQVANYREALVLEKKSRDFYLAQAEAASQGAKAVFMQLADEEGRHMFLLENMIEYVSRPLNWLENSEFNHLSEY